MRKIGRRQGSQAIFLRQTGLFANTHKYSSATMASPFIDLAAMPKYLFTHDQTDNSFPDRIRLVTADEDAAFLQKTEELTGTVLETEAIQMLEELMARCEANESLRVELVDAPYWRFIEIRFKPDEAEALAAEKANKGTTGGGVIP